MLLWAMIAAGSLSGLSLVLYQLRMWHRDSLDYGLRRHIFDHSRDLKVLDDLPAIRRADRTELPSRPRDVQPATAEVTPSPPQP